MPTYKVGYRHSDGYLNLNNSAIVENGITFGLSKKMFPKKYNGQIFAGMVINLGVELGQRGTTDNSNFEEKYAKVYLGFTFSDKWFNKPQYD